MVVRIRFLRAKFALVLFVSVILAEGYDIVQADSQDVIVSVSTDKSHYGWGETVMITVSVTNNGPSTLDFIFADSHQAGYSIFMLRGQTLELVWTTLNDGYYQLVTDLTLEPGETKNYTFQWAQVSETDVKIKPRTYVFLGYFVGTDPWWTWSERSTFDIRGRGYREH